MALNVQVLQQYLPFQQRSMLKLDIGVAGGGIGGLAVSVALSRLGHTVTVYEAASELAQVCVIAQDTLHGLDSVDTFDRSVLVFK